MILFVKVLLAVVGISVFFGCSVYRLTTFLGMVSKVNEQLPPERRFVPSSFWGPGKHADLRAAYRRLYPDGPLLRRSDVALGVAAVTGVMLFLGYALWPRR